MAALFPFDCRLKHRKGREARAQHVPMMLRVIEDDNDEILCCLVGKKRLLPMHTALSPV